MEKKGILFILGLFSLIALISFVSAAPKLINVNFQYSDGVNIYSMHNGLSGFLMVINNNPLTNYYVQFANTTTSSETLKPEMFGLFLVNSSVSSTNIKAYYDAKGIPEPFLSYLKNAADGLYPFAYINGATLKLNDAAVHDILGQTIDMTIPGDYLPGKYVVSGRIKNSSNSESPVNFILIIEAFNLQVNLPVDKIYLSKQVQFNVTAGTIVPKIEYADSDLKWRTLCTNCKSSTSKVTFGEGQHNLTIRASSLGNTQQKNVAFFIDSQKPVISGTLPGSNSFTNGSNFFIKYTEANLEKITLFYGNASTEKIGCPSGTNKNCSFFPDLSSYDGKKIAYKFSILDIADNTKESINTAVYVDTSSPVITSFNDSVSGKYVTFNISINETNLNRINYIDHNDISPRWNILCSVLSHGNCVVKKYFKTGDYNLTIQVLDKAGNSVEQSLLVNIV